MARQTLEAVETAGAPGDREMTIDQLAQEAGMSVRNIRAYQSRGLLPPPEVRATTGYYANEHLARLRLVGEMQADGYNLASIKRLLDGTPGAAEQVLGFKRAITAPFETDEPAVLTAEDLASRFGPDVAAKALRQAEKLGLLLPLGEGRYESPMPSLLNAAEEVMGRGVSLTAALQVVEQIKRHSEGLSRSFVKLFLEEVWKPFADAGHPDERWPEILDAIESLRPLASNALLAVFQHTMTREVDSAFGEHFARGKRER